MDFAEKAQFFTLDVITDIALGNSFGFIDSDSDCYSYIEKTGESLGLMMLIGVFPFLNKILHSALCRNLMPSKKDALGLGKIMRYVSNLMWWCYNNYIYWCCSIAHEVVAERFGPNRKEKRDMLGSFVRHGLSQDEVESESLVQTYVFSSCYPIYVERMN